jgi:hypothetical protein
MDNRAMALTQSAVLAPDALEANRRGELTDGQRQGFGNLARDNRKSQLQFAGIALVIAVLVGGFASSTAPILTRGLITIVALAIAAVLVVRSVTGADALTRDLRSPRVEFVEGAIGKRRIGNGRARDTYFLDVGDRRFTVARATYDTAPDAGHVRIYYLPRSRKIVNFERLPDEQFQHATPQDLVRDIKSPDLLRTFGAALHSHTRQETNEARATLTAMGEAMQAAFGPHAAPPPRDRDPRPLGEAIVGAWTNGLMTISFSADGRVTADTMGHTQQGRWSIDSGGRLLADVMGQQQAADAWISGDQLTITADGQGFTLTRRA